MKYNENSLGVTKKGKEFSNFRSCFTDSDRGYGYIRIIGGDETSKRPKFVFITWCGPSVPPMQKVTFMTHMTSISYITNI